MRLEIDHGYDTAAEAFVNGNQVAALLYDNLTDKLSGSSGMAGNDSTSTDFAIAYDTGAQDAVDALDDLVDAFANVGRLTETSITNHRNANRNSVLAGATIYDGSAPLPDGEYVDVLPVSIPTSLGSDLSSFPDELNWILDQVEGFVWPNADTSRLREASLAWQNAADGVDRLTDHCTSAVTHFHTQRSPEIPLAVDATNDLESMSVDLGAHLRAIGQACEQYAEDVDQQRQCILDLVYDLLRDAVIIQGFGILLGAFTAGLTAAGATAINIAKIAAEAPKLIRIIDCLKALATAAANTIRVAATALKPLRTKLLKFKTARTTRAASQSAETAAKRPFPGGGLKAHEKHGSHTLERHVGRTDEQLLARFETNSRMKYSSSFPDKATAESAIGDLLHARKADIAAWLKSDGGKLTLNGRAGDDIIGRVADRAGNFFDVSGLRVVLRKDPSFPDGYRIWTAFPQP